MGIIFRLRNVGLTLTLVVLLIYFLFHAINGERGVLSFFRLSNKFEKLHAELEAVRADRIQLEHKVNLLRSNSLDLDLLEEQSKKLLGFARKNEIVYFTKK